MCGKVETVKNVENLVARVNWTKVDEPSLINDNFNLTLFSIKTAKS